MWVYFCKAHTRGILLVNFLRNQKIKIFKNIFPKSTFLEYFFKNTIFLQGPPYLDFYDYLLIDPLTKKREIFKNIFKNS